MPNEDLHSGQAGNYYFAEQSKKTGPQMTFRIPGITAFRIPLFIPKPTNPLSSSVLLIYGFLAITLIGTIFLVLPVSSRAGVVTSPLNALFTAASAVSVTGLTVVDTGTYWSPFGQAILLVLFQIGGLGFIAGATLLLMAIGGGLGLRDRLLLSESVGTDQLGGIKGLVVRISIFALAIEISGAIIFYLRWLAEGNTFTSLWAAVFHAVSAFNNCGMDIFGNNNSMVAFQGDSFTLWTTSLLVFLGSTGYVVIMDVLRSKRFIRLTLDTKIVLVTTLSLVALGAFFYFVSEYSNPATLGPLSVARKFTVAVFQSMTPRTAGFSAIDIGSLNQIMLFFTVLLMCIGGAAGSTAGGVKVNTLGVLVITFINVVKGNESISAFGRQFSRQVIFRALSLFMVYLIIASLVILLLTATERFTLKQIIFESFSALSTVGLSTGITPELSVTGRLILVIVMFIGRLGPLAFMALLARRHHPSIIDYPRESVRLG
jgi:trk system potassium uptake protein